MTADHMYSCHNREKFTQEVRMELSSKPKTFSQFAIAVFGNLDKLLSVLEKKITFVPSTFPELLIPRYVFTWIPESPVSEYPFEVNVLMSRQRCSSPHSSTFRATFH